MKIASRLVLLALLGGLGFWLWTVLFPNPEKVVLGRVSSLAATATVSAGDGAITRATKVSNLIGYFSTDAVISYDLPGIGARTLSGLDEIRETAAGGFANVTSLQGAVPGCHRAGKPGQTERGSELHRASEHRRQQGFWHPGTAPSVQENWRGLAHYAGGDRKHAPMN